MLPFSSRSRAAVLAFSVLGAFPGSLSPDAGAAVVLGKSSPAPTRTANAQAPTAPAQPRENDPSQWGSLSLGEPNHGRLLYGVRPENGKLFELVTPDFAWGTEETVTSLSRAVQAVQARYPGTAPLHIGHISGPSGGKLKPHLSHQSGRDVDVGFFYSDKRVWYRRGTPANLDLPRMWTLIRSFITETDVEMILVDRSLHASLRAEGKRQGESEAWLQSIFKGQGELPPLIRHARGHTTHLHVRFFSPLAQTNAQRAYPLLLERKLVDEPLSFTLYKARAGDTLSRLASRFGVSVEAIQRANGMRGTLIQARVVYRIPREGAPPPASAVVCPPRRLPAPSPR